MRTYSRAEDETFNYPVVYIGKMYKLKQSVGEIDAIRPLEKSQGVCKKTNKQKEKEITKQSQNKLQGNKEEKFVQRRLVT